MKCFQLGDDHQYREVGEGERVDWIHFENPDEEEQKLLREHYQIPKDFILDALDRYEVPRQETVKTKDGTALHLSLVLYPEIKKQLTSYKEYETLPLAIIMAGQQLLTISTREPSFLEGVYQDIDPNHYPTKGNEIVLDILWELTSAYIAGITEIDETIQDMEENIVDSTKNESFYRLIAIHKNLVYFHTGITENHRIIQHFIKSEHYAEDASSQTLLHDIQVISRQAAVMVNESNQMIDHLSEVFSSVISNNLNNVMKFLTSLTIVLTIPTIIGSFWGMNVGLPLEKNPFAFVLLIIISILLSIITVFWLKKNDYL
ncbi:magnesium transporter CorA family protein [Jeotgalibaca caeni]|uniref:magnesium transporter CorA family protein n=1 Tax=Jeotgalibaca caeni TaxID=3028623 RepID=UPI00237E3237|nr:magnesium transporter CorA family protein [Jeotgalibaca caeni]MDE1548430.1 magnesium transporter CorA family protein [Jeotgalibaca caeni]